MSAQPTEAPDQPPGWEQTTADLLAETAFLARELGHPRVRTAGAAGILNDSAPSTVWVHSQIDIDALLREVTGWRPSPCVMVPEHAESLADRLAARGWDTAPVVERFWRELDPPPCRPLPRTELLARPVTPDDLEAVRRLHVLSFDAEDSAAYLPDSIFEVPGLRLFLAVCRTDPDQLLGAVGVRLRHRGALVFGLATARHRQRGGIGATLVAEGLDWAQANGAPFAIADVDVPASSLWTQLGFRVTGRWRRCSSP